MACTVHVLGSLPPLMYDPNMLPRFQDLSSANDDLSVSGDT